MYIFRKLILFILGIFVFSCQSEDFREKRETYNSKVAGINLEKMIQEVDFFEKEGKDLNAIEVKNFNLNEHLLVELISEESYNSVKQEKIRYYLKDTLALKKIGGVIKFGKLNLVDKENVRLSEKYLFLGYFDMVNQYLIQGIYKDSTDFKMVDKKTGQILNSFVSYPFFSENAKFTAIMKSTINEGTLFEIYSYRNGFYKNIIKAHFKNWISFEEHERAFWGKDGSFYLSVINKSESDVDSKNLKYIKITLN